MTLHAIWHYNHVTHHRLHVAFRLAEATLSGKSTTLAGLKLQLWPASISDVICAKIGPYILTESGTVEVSCGDFGGTPGPPPPQE